MVIGSLSSLPSTPKRLITVSGSSRASPLKSTRKQSSYSSNLFKLALELQYPKEPRGAGSSAQLKEVLGLYWIPGVSDESNAAERLAVQRGLRKHGYWFFLTEARLERGRECTMQAADENHKPSRGGEPVCRGLIVDCGGALMALIEQFDGSKDGLGRRRSSIPDIIVFDCDSCEWNISDKRIQGLLSKVNELAISFRFVPEFFPTEDQLMAVSEAIKGSGLKLWRVEEQQITSNGDPSFVLATARKIIRAQFIRPSVLDAILFGGVVGNDDPSRSA